METDVSLPTPGMQQGIDGPPLPGGLTSTSCGLMLTATAGGSARWAHRTFFNRSILCSLKGREGGEGREGGHNKGRGQYKSTFFS